MGNRVEMHCAKFVVLIILILPSVCAKPSEFELLKEIWAAPEFSWQLLAVIAAAASVGLAALWYALARLFVVEELQKFARGEIVHALSMVVLVAFFIVFVDVAVEVANILMAESTRIGAPNLWLAMQDPEAKASPFTVGYFYTITMRRCMTALYKRIVCVASIPLAFVDISPAAEGTAPSPTLTFATALTQLIYNVAFGLTTNLVYLILAFDVQKYILSFSQATMLTVFLPLGVVLRALPFTRAMGNLFVAIAIGFYFVHPLTYGIILVVTQPLGQVESRCGITGLVKYDPAKGIDVAPDESTWMCAKLAVELPVGIVESIPPIAKMTYTTISTWLGAAAKHEVEVKGLLDYYQSVMGETFAFAIIYPLVAFAITLTFIRSFALFLGAEVQEFLQGLARLL